MLVIEKLFSLGAMCFENTVQLYFELCRDSNDLSINFVNTGVNFANERADYVVHSVRI